MIHSSWEYYASNGSMVQKLLLCLGKLLVGQAGGGDRERDEGELERNKNKENLRPVRPVMSDIMRSSNHFILDWCQLGCPLLTLFWGQV